MAITPQYRLVVQKLKEIAKSNAAVADELPELMQVGIWLKHYENERHTLLEEIKTLRQQLSAETWMKNQIYAKYIQEACMIDDFLNQQILESQERLKELSPAGEEIPPMFSKEALDYMSVRTRYSDMLPPQTTNDKPQTV